MLIKEKIKKYQPKEIAKNLDIPYSTLARWIKSEKIENHVKFIEFLNYLDINTTEFTKEYTKKEGI